MSHHRRLSPRLSPFLGGTSTLFPINSEYYYKFLIEFNLSGVHHSTSQDST